MCVNRKLRQWIKQACEILEGNRNFLGDLQSTVIDQPLPLQSTACDSSATEEAPVLFADNQGGIDWSHSGAITKRLRHWNIKEVAIRDAIVAGEVTLAKIPGPINPADLFTKEMKDKQHFLQLRSCLMSPRGNPSTTLIDANSRSQRKS